MAYNKDIPYNDLPDLPPVTFMESNELLRVILLRIFGCYVQLKTY